MSANHLFTFANLQPPGDKAGPLEKVGHAYSKHVDFSAPVICPPGSEPRDFYDVKSLLPSDIQHIDVVNNFDWTLTPPHARKQGTQKGSSDPSQYGFALPYIRMYEYSLNFSSFLNHLKYLLQSGKDAVQAFDQSIPGKKADGTDTLYTDIKQGAQGAASVGADFIDSVFGENTSANIKEKISTLTDAVTVDQTGIPYYLRGYHGLYDVRPTGFRYSIPYFNTDWKTVRNGWGDITGGNNIIGSLAGIGQAVAGAYVDAASTFRTGAYFERPKSYDFHGEGESVTFSFPLYNTRNQESVQKNFELCTMLVYQQLANKTSRVLLDPPVMYEVEIPGKFYSPYAYIANLSIEAIGAQTHRKLDLLTKFKDGLDQPATSDGTGENGDASTSDSTPKNKQPGRPCALTEGKNDVEDLTVDAIIPDVWNITITLQSLVPSTKNLYYHSLAGANNIYDVKVIQAQQQGFENTINQGLEQGRVPAGQLDLPDNFGADIGPGEAIV